MVLQSVKSVFALLTLIGIGYYFTGKPWFGKQGMDFLSKFTIDVTIPFYMFYNIYKDIGTKEALFELVYKLPVTFFLIVVCLVLTWVFGAVMHVDRCRKNTFVVAVGFSNVVFIGFPVIQALWGEGITSVGVVYYISSTILFWTVGVWLLRRDGRSESAKGGAFPGNLKQLFSPSIIGMLLAMAAIVAGIRLPDFVLTPLSMISGVTSPSALIFIGSVIRNMDRSAIRSGKDIYLALIMRFILTPVIAALFLRPMPVSTEMKQVFFVLTAMPSMTQMGIMAKEYESDYEFACTVVMLTTIIGMLTIPLYMFIMQTFRIF